MTQQQFDRDVTRDIRALVARGQTTEAWEAVFDLPDETLVSIAKSILSSNYDHTLFSKEADALFEHKPVSDESDSGG